MTSAAFVLLQFAQNFCKSTALLHEVLSIVIEIKYSVQIVSKLSDRCKKALPYLPLLVRLW